MNLRLLVFLDRLGYEMRSVHHSVADRTPLPPLGSWHASSSVWAQLSPFPSARSHNRARQIGHHPM
eukprot:5311829-Prymnesium_polylepis.1